MSKKIKLSIGIILIMLCVILLLIALLTIWDIMDNQIAKEAFLKVLYTFGSIFIASLAVLLISEATKTNK